MTVDQVKLVWNLAGVFDNEPPAGDDGSPAAGQAPEGAPAAGQEPGSAGTKPEDGDPGSADAAQAPQVSWADVIETSTASEDPAEVIKNLERDRAASAREGKKLAAQLKAAGEVLKKQGLRLVFGEEGEVDLALEDPEVAKSTPAKPVYDKLPPQVQDLFVTDAQAAIDQVWARAQAAFARALPTLDRVPPQATDAEKDLAYERLAQAKTVDGLQWAPDIKEARPAIEQFLAKQPKAVREAAEAHPQAMYGLVHGLLRHRMDVLREHVAQQAKLKAKEAEKAKDDADLHPTGDGVVTLGADSDASKAAARRIAAAGTGGFY